MLELDRSQESRRAMEDKEDGSASLFLTIEYLDIGELVINVRSLLTNKIS